LGNDYNSSKNYRDAIEHIEKALPIFTDTKTKSYLLSAYEAMITANNGLRNYGHSVRFYEKYVQLKDSLNKNELNSALDSLKVKFHTEQTETENAALTLQSTMHKKTIRFQQVTILSSLIAMVLLVALILLGLRNRRNMKRINAKLHDLSEFKASMTHFLVHDLKNPLNTIINLDACQITQQQAEGVKQSGWQMLQIVSNLLDLGKYEHTSMTLTTGDVWLAKVIHQAFNETAYLAEQKSIRLVLQFQTGYLVAADQEIIKRVFINLFTNAIKFSPAGGHLRIFAELTTASMAKIVVQDEGEGISPDYLPFIFEKFTQGIPRSSGFSVSTGIGLAFCKMAVEAHGGTIGVVSDKGHGSSFWLTLPLSESKALMPDIPFDIDGMQESIPRLQFTVEEKEYLAPFCKALQNTSIHQLTEVKDIVKTIEERSVHLSTWKQLILQALSVCNEPKYHELIRLCHDEPV
jgi:signal transduction histidine kinase